MIPRKDIRKLKFRSFITALLPFIAFTLMVMLNRYLINNHPAINDVIVNVIAGSFLSILFVLILLSVPVCLIAVIYLSYRDIYQSKLNKLKNKSDQ